MTTLYEIESVYSQWVHSSIILLTCSLIFFRISTSGINSKNDNIKKYAVLFSGFLVLLNLLFIINSTILYYQRTKKLLSDKTGGYLSRNIYFIGGLLLILVEIILFYYIIFY